jgi:glyoxylase-like metal-dependent hydrolase (beta-lactamase superfamily II)
LDSDATLPKDLPTDLYTHASNGSVFHDLQDGQVFQDRSNGTTLFRVLHTPGHTADSVALHLPSEKALYTADTVLGYGTTVFEDLAAYLACLTRLLDLNSSADGAGYDTLYPGHGPVVEQGRETISLYIQHRLDREKEILRVLRSPIPQELLGGSTTDDLWTTWNIVRVIYKDYPENLWLPASQTVELHLRKLQGDEVVSHIAGEGPEKKWRILQSDTNID